MALASSVGVSINDYHSLHLIHFFILHSAVFSSLGDCHYVIQTVLVQEGKASSWRKVAEADGMEEGGGASSPVARD